MSRAIAKGFAGLPKPKHDFVIALGGLMNRAGELRLWRTMHALHAAKRVLGWELAENADLKSSRRPG